MANRPVLLTTNTYATAPNKLKPARISRRPNHRLSSNQVRIWHTVTTASHQKPQAEAVLGVSPFVAAGVK